MHTENSHIITVFTQHTGHLGTYCIAAEMVRVV